MAATVLRVLQAATWLTAMWMWNSLGTAVAISTLRRPDLVRVRQSTIALTAVGSICATAAAVAVTAIEPTIDLLRIRGWELGPPTVWIVGAAILAIQVPWSIMRLRHATPLLVLAHDPQVGPVVFSPVRRALYSDLFDAAVDGGNYVG